MLQKLSQDQLKIGLALAFALYLANSQSSSTVAKTNRTSDRNANAIALNASLPPVDNTVSGCNSAQRRVQVESDSVLNLRSYANGPVLGTLAPGEIVTAQEIDGAWLKVTTTSGQSGWAFRQYLGCR